MTQITGPLKWYTVAKALETAVYAALTTKPERHGVVPGAIAWDQCECGLLAVSIGRVYLSDDFPDPIETVIGAGCDPAWDAGEIVLQIIRCAPPMDSQGNPPTVEALEAAARVMATDAHELVTATARQLCTMKNETNEIIEYVMSGREPQGPEGACTGTELRVTVGLMRA